MTRLKSPELYYVKLQTGTPDKDWLGYRATISEKGVRKKERGFAAQTSLGGYHFILPGGFEGFSGPKGLTVFPSFVKAKALVACPDWKDIVQHVKVFGHQEDCAYVSLNDCEMFLGQAVMEVNPERVIYTASKYDDGLAHRLAEIMGAIGIEYGTSELKEKRPSTGPKAFYDSVVKPFVNPGYKL